MRPDSLNPLFRDVTTLNGVGPKIAALIGKVAGPRLVDLLFTAPINVIDRSARPKIEEAAFGALATLTVRVDKHEPPPKGRRLPYKILCSDETGFITLVFFHARGDYLSKTLPEGEERLISGKVEEFNGARQMTHPDYVVKPEDSEALPLFEPVYPLTAGLNAAPMRKAVHASVEQAPVLPEWLDDAYLTARQWSDWQSSLKALHTPDSKNALGLLSQARQRLAYDELLASQLALGLVRQHQTTSTGRALIADGDRLKKAMQALPYTLTGDQRDTLKQIHTDMTHKDRMVRLVQGDVGSGKTIVAFLAMVHAVDAGVQAALMAPTEILARQHIDSLADLAAQTGIRMALLTGRVKGAKRQLLLDALKAGEIDILVGTHAVFQSDVEFADLGLAIIDEQHRFGVHQRISLSNKGYRPDLLVMTATPIPRTLALTLYGDMEISQIREKPPGRKPIETRAAPLNRLEEISKGLARVIARGDQAYWICPLVEESEVLDLANAEARFEALNTLFPGKVGLVHGRMNGDEKDEIMKRFYDGALSILVATTVIEVGVNAPNATAMIIEHAERFGLAQLHQLRGRVGRGEKPSSCVLLYKAPLGETATARLNVLRQSEDGFVIAEEDLRLRGAGDMLGAAQSGFPVYRLADLSVHAELLAAARDDAKLIIARDPDLASDRGKALRVLLYLFQRDEAISLLQAG